MTYRLLCYVLIAIGLAGCSISPFGETGSFYTDFQVFEEKMCAGMYEIEYPLSNGTKPERLTNKMLFWETTKNIERYYVTQSSPTVCWSASLETVFRYVGLNFTQLEFRQALSSKCPKSTDSSATANQVLFAASERHAKGEGIWLGKYPKRGIDIDYCDALNLLGLIPGFDAGCRFESSYHRAAQEFFFVRQRRIQEGDSLGTITMSRTDRNSGRVIYEKEIVLIKTLPDLLRAMDKGYPIFVGMNNKGYGHTVVLKDVSFYVDKYQKMSNGRYFYEINKNSYLKNVKYLDPVLGPAPIPMSGDKFLEKVAFSFYIRH